ncbi:1,4-alpha-glucan branching protein GlgB [Nocardioidaceae bacterium]|nr:1,4-alpha-glucan branching protein GlgB [Nocardioidaceae bacterium]
MRQRFDAHLEDYVLAARWFGGKGRHVGHTSVDRRGEVPTGVAGCRLVHDLVEVHYVGGDQETYHLPLTVYGTEQPHLEHALVDHPAGSWMYDAVHDPLAHAAWVRAFRERLSSAGLQITADEQAVGLSETRAELFSGEQSNSSLRYGEQALLKIFRKVTQGSNPDIEIHAALTAAGEPHVGALYGVMRADGTELAMLQELIVEARDGWETTVADAEQGRDEVRRTRDLGSAIRDIHTHLAATLPVQDASVTAASVAAQMARRLDAAVDMAPTLAALGPRLREAYAALGALTPADFDRQRIHGDLHLGQTLVTDAGWKVVDFEGEPAKTLAERQAPDSVWRDVAGMMRSFDYAAQVAGLTDDAATWRRGQQQAFLAGYLGVDDGRDPLAALSPAQRVQLRAYEADKAVYEVVYETRNRPDWVGIPLGALHRLFGDTQEATAVTSSDQTPTTPLPVDHGVLEQLVAGEHGDPHAVLGPHPHPDGTGTTLRVLKPLAESVVAVLGGGDDATRVELAHEHEGVWAGVLPTPEVPDYRLEVTWPGSAPSAYDDAYRFLPTVSETDLHLFNEGRHEQLWTVLGARVRTYDGMGGPAVTGTSFAVWAPGARGVRVRGDFNSWDGREHPMRQLGTSGVWEIFVPGVGSGTAYKYSVLGRDGDWREKADPMAAYAEVPPATASVVFDSSFTWGDEAWMSARAEGRVQERPMSVYEVHLPSWRRGRSYVELAEELTAYVTDMGFTHVEFMPVMEHPFGGSWGYQVTGYYAPTSRLGDPDGFRTLVDALHRAGVGVLVDWVPAHFPKDEFALARFDGGPLYEDPNPLRGEHPDWGTYVFDFGRREVRNFLVANALYWAEEFHVDGLRVDAVASMLYLDYSREPGQWQPNQHGGRENLEAVQLLQEMTATVAKRVPGVVTVAEESTSWPGVTKPTTEGGLGFDFKWNMGWMHDSLEYVAKDPLYRSHHHGGLTFSLVYAWSEHYVLPISHDEVVHGKGSLLRKMPGDRWKQLAGVRSFLAYMWTHPGKQLVFMGSEFAQDSEWAEHRELDWGLLEDPQHAGVQSLVRDLNRVYAARPALWSRDDSHEGFSWLLADDAEHNVLAYARRGRDGEELVCVVNFSAVPHHDFRLPLPAAGTWTELLNSDAQVYGGSGVGNLGRVVASDSPYAGQPAHASVSLPPLGALWFVRES